MKLKRRCVDEGGRETSLGNFVRAVEQKLQTEGIRLMTYERSGIP